MILGDYTCIIHIRNQEIDPQKLVVVIYNKLLLNHLWSCVLKLIS